MCAVCDTRGALEGAGWVGFLAFPLRGDLSSPVDVLHRLFRVVAADHLWSDVMLFLFTGEQKQEFVSFLKFIELLLICDSILMVCNFVQKHLSLSCYV